MAPDLETIYSDSERWFSVLREPGSGRTFLEVVCGGIAMYSRRIEMNDDEIAAFHRDPHELDTLVLRVQKWPERYADRIE